MNSSPLFPVQTEKSSSKITPTRILRSAEALRIAFVSDAVIGRNGVGTYYQDLLQQIRPHVAEAQLYSPATAPDELEQFSIPLPGDKTQRLAWPDVGRLNSLLTSLNPNLIVLPSLGPYSFFGLRYARQTGTPIAIVNHTDFDKLLGLYWPKILSRPVQMALHRLQRSLMRGADGVAAMSAEAINTAADLGAQFCRVVGTPLPSNFFTTQRTEVERRIRRVLFAGRFAKEKGIGTLLQSAAKLPDIEFTFAGDGPLRWQVTEAAKRLPNVRFIGWVDRVGILGEIDRCQALVLPSKFETFGTVALECLARRRFVLVSRDCGISNWPSLKQGLFFVERDECLHKSLSRLHSQSHESRLQVAALAWKEVAKFHTSAIQSWLDFLCDTLARSNKDSGK
ncbi:MAG: glycosyltransferase [Aureliella sp.]